MILETVHLLVSHLRTPPRVERIQTIVLFKNATLIFIQITILISASGDVLLPMLSLPYDDCSLQKKQTNKQKEKGKQSEHKQFR